MCWLGHRENYKLILHKSHTNRHLGTPILGQTGKFSEFRYRETGVFSRLGKSITLKYWVKKGTGLTSDRQRNQKSLIIGAYSHGGERIVGQFYCG